MRSFFLALFVFSSLLSTSQTEGTYQAAIENHREAYKQGFVQDPRAPLEEPDLVHMQFYAPDASYRVVCIFEATPDAEPFDLPTYSGKTKSFRKYGVLTFEWEGQPHSLAVYQNLKTIRMPHYRDHLFLPFRDLTNGETTYGGGRYIDLTISDLEKDEIYLDFNTAYNPWCAYSDGYNCPIPPAENHLEMEVRAGEKTYRGEKKQRKQ